MDRPTSILNHEPGGLFMARWCEVYNFMNLVLYSIKLLWNVWNV